MKLKTNVKALPWSGRLKMAIQCRTLKMAVVLVMSVLIVGRGSAWAQPHARLVYHNGPVLNSFQIFPLYYGNWNSAEITAQQNYLIGLAGYLSGQGAPPSQQSMMRQYGVGFATVGPQVTANPTATPTTLKKEDIITIIHANQNGGKLPPYNLHTLIMVFPAAGFKLDNCTGCGYHDAESASAFWAVVPHDVGPTLALVTAHEVFEAAADPAINVANGWDEAVDGCTSIVNLSFGAIPGAADNSQGGTCSTTGFTSFVQAFDLVSPQAPEGAPIAAVSRGLDKLDVFLTDSSGAVRSAAWEPDFPDWWHGWWWINGGLGAPGAAVTAVSRSANKLDIFAVGQDGRVWTAAWEPDFTDGWHGWWPIGNIRVPARAAINVVSRSTDKLDIFVADVNGVVQTAAWEPDFTDGWHGWWPIGNIQVPPGAPVNAVSRSTDKLDIFVTDVNGVIQTAAWEPNFSSWHGWWPINGGQSKPGGAVTAVSRSTDKLDVFVVGLDGHVWTAAWEPDFGAWHGWWTVGSILAPVGAPVNVASRSTEKLDIFVADNNGAIQTAAWQPGFSGWHGWWSLNGGQAVPGAPVGVVSRSTDKLDVFVVGPDGRAYTAAWEPDFTSWHGWWQMTSLRQ